MTGWTSPAGRRVTLRLLDAALTPMGAVVVDGMENANAGCPLQIEATVTCDLGHEHGVGKMELRPWPSLVVRKAEP